MDACRTAITDVATMATGGPDLFARLSEEILTCEICSEEFDSSTRPPQVLPCYHCYCGVCVKKLTKDGKLQCPECRQEAAADKPFPMETVRLTLLDWKKSVFCQKGVACSNCGEGSKASSKCQDCAEFYCSECTDYHRKFTMSIDHTVVSLSEAAKSPEKLLQTLSEKCDGHPEDKLKLFCLTCSTPVCSMCALTQHHKGHEFVELAKVLEDLKKKNLTVCKQLDEAQEGFKQKAEALEASLQELECKHRRANDEVKDAFATVVSIVLAREAEVLEQLGAKNLTVCEQLDEAQEGFKQKAEALEASPQALQCKQVKDTVATVVSIVTAREAEVLEQLGAKVKSERLQLEDQLATFKSLQAATQSAADYGRRLVSLSLASHLAKTSADLERTAADLKKKLTTPVVAAATIQLQVETVKVEELRALLQFLGTIRSSVVFLGGGGQPLLLPDIRLDGSRCHGDCTVSGDGLWLTNQSHPPSPSLSQQKFKFVGTSGTAALPDQTCYWQVHLKAWPDPQTTVFNICEVGVASLEALQASEWYIGLRPHTAFTVNLYVFRDTVRCEVFHRGSELSLKELASFKLGSPVERTLGFLLDVQRKRLVILDVDGRQVLGQREMPLSQPLWPCVSLYNPPLWTPAAVCVRVESGKHVTLTPDMVSVLKSRLK